MHQIVAGVALVAAVLSGCQSSDSQDVLELQQSPVSDAASAELGQERIGAGGAQIAMLLPRSVAGTSGLQAAEFRNGAALAVNELGEQHVSLTIYDTGGNASVAVAKAGEAASAGARLIVASRADAAAVSNIDPAMRPPVIGLAEQNADGDFFAFISDEIDGAAESAAYAVAAGKKDVVVVVPKQFGAASAAELKARVEEQGARVIGAITADSAGAASAGNEDLIERGQAFLFVSSEDLPQRVAAIRSHDMIQPGALILGTSDWSADHIKNPALDGAYIPVLEQDGLKEVGARYRQAYGRPISTEAAYAYDVIALAAGIVRVMGMDGLKGETFRQEAGFRGATGKFRFERDGSVRRLFSIYRVSNGSLKLVDPAPEGF